MAQDDQQPLRLLHLCSAYCRDSVHSSLARHIVSSGVRQVVYCAARSAEEMRKAAKIAQEDRDVALFARHILSPIDRIMFRRKIRRVYSDCLEAVGSLTFDVMHAHSMYSDGAVALRLCEASGVPYIVSVRNTDLNYFMRLRPDLQRLMLRVVDRAQRVAFLSPAYAARFATAIPAQWRRRVQAKSILLPNGIGREWLDRTLSPPAGGECRILCVQDGTDNKNVRGLLQACHVLSAERTLTVTVAGRQPKIPRALLAKLKFDVQFIDYIGDRERLASIYGQHHVFALPSFHESFGMVYLEALACGLPVLYSTGEGPSGWLDAEGVGEAVRPQDPLDIARGLDALIRRHAAVRSACRRIAATFEWSCVSRRYVEAYREVMDPTLVYDAISPVCTPPK